MLSHTTLGITMEEWDALVRVEKDLRIGKFNSVFDMRFWHSCMGSLVGIYIGVGTWPYFDQYSPVLEDMFFPTNVHLHLVTPRMAADTISTFMNTGKIIFDPLCSYPKK